MLAIRCYARFTSSGNALTFLAPYAILLKLVPLTKQERYNAFDIVAGYLVMLPRVVSPVLRVLTPRRPAWLCCLGLFLRCYEY